MGNWRKTISDAFVLSQILPDWVPAPSSVSNDMDYPDADIVFEWCYSSKDLVTIWMSEGCVSYAGMIDGMSAHGRTSARGVISQECINLLHAVVEKMRPAVGKSDER